MGHEQARLAATRLLLAHWVNHLSSRMYKSDLVCDSDRLVLVNACQGSCFFDVEFSVKINVCNVFFPSVTNSVAFPSHEAGDILLPTSVSHLVSWLHHAVGEKSFGFSPPAPPPRFSSL